MAENHPADEGQLIGAAKERNQTQTPAGDYVKRGTATGRFMDIKTTDKTPFKGVCRESK